MSLLYLDNQIEIHYTDSGIGKDTLLFIHGLASYSDVWEKNIEVLQKYYRCIAIDLPGHGLSSKANYPYTISFYAQIVIGLVERLHLEPCVLVGHSMGGQTAIRLVLDTPQYFTHLVLVAPAGFERFSSSEKALMSQFIATSILGSAQYLKFILNLKNYFYEFNEKEYEKLNELNQDFYTKPNHLPMVLSRSILSMVEDVVWDELSAISLPTLVFFGKDDQLIPNKFLHPSLTTSEVAWQGSNQIPQVQLKIYEKCGHFLQYQFPNRFNMDLYKFLNPLIFL